MRRNWTEAISNIADRLAQEHPTYADVADKVYDILMDIAGDSFASVWLTEEDVSVLEEYIHDLRMKYEEKYLEEGLKGILKPNARLTLEDLRDAYEWANQYEAYELVNQSRSLDTVEDAWYRMIALNALDQQVDDAIELIYPTDVDRPLPLTAYEFIEEIYRLVYPHSSLEELHQDLTNEYNYMRQQLIDLGEDISFDDLRELIELVSEQSVPLYSFLGVPKKLDTMDQWDEWIDQFIKGETLHDIFTREHMELLADELESAFDDAADKTII